MPIRPYLNGKVFDPELISEMSIALESVCDALQLQRVDDRLTRFVSEKIIQFAQYGVQDADTLRLMTLKEFKAD